MSSAFQSRCLLASGKMDGGAKHDVMHHSWPASEVLLVAMVRRVNADQGRHRHGLAGSSES